MDQNTARAPERSLAHRTHHARQRKAVAQKLCNHLARTLERTIDGDRFLNYYLSGALQPLPMHFLHPLVLAEQRRDHRWSAPKGSLNLACVAGMLFRHFKISDGELAGEPYEGILASNHIMARIAGCSPDTWARACRPFLEHLDILVGAPTVKQSRPGWRSRNGTAMGHREGRTLYVAGDGLLELLGLRDRRIDISRRALVAEARKQLAQKWRNSDPKAPEKKLSTRASFSGRARGRKPQAHTAVKTFHRPRRSVRPPAASISKAAPPTTVAKSTATAVDVTTAESQRLGTVNAADVTPAAPISPLPALGEALAEGDATAPALECAAPSIADSNPELVEALSRLAAKMGGGAGELAIAEAAAQPVPEAPSRAGYSVEQVPDVDEGDRRRRPAPPIRDAGDVDKPTSVGGLLSDVISRLPRRKS